MVFLTYSASFPLLLFFPIFSEYRIVYLLYSPQVPSLFQAHVLVREALVPIGLGLAGQLSLLPFLVVLYLRRTVYKVGALGFSFLLFCFVLSGGARPFLALRKGRFDPVFPFSLSRGGSVVPAVLATIPFLSDRIAIYTSAQFSI